MSEFVKSVFRYFGGGGIAPASALLIGSREIKYLTHRKPFEEQTMTKESNSMIEDNSSQTSPKAARFLGSLKDALAAAGRAETGGATSAGRSASSGQGTLSAAAVPPPIQSVPVEPAAVISPPAVTKSAAEAARDARASTGTPTDKPEKGTAPATTRVTNPSSSSVTSAPARTQLVRGKKAVERGTFESDPVVAWLVIVGGPGIGQYRPIFEGNNAIGRSNSQRIGLDFGDDSISSEEQAFIRYDSSDRSFLFVPNLAKTNVVSVNNKRPTGAVELAQMDVITMGRTQLVFVPFCGSEFDWAELSDKA